MAAHGPRGLLGHSAEGSLAGWACQTPASLRQLPYLPQPTDSMTKALPAWPCPRCQHALCCSAAHSANWSNPGVGPGHRAAWGQWTLSACFKSTAMPLDHSQVQ